MRTIQLCFQSQNLRKNKEHKLNKTITSGLRGYVFGKNAFENQNNNPRQLEQLKAKEQRYKSTKEEFEQFTKIRQRNSSLTIDNLRGLINFPTINQKNVRQGVPTEYQSVARNAEDNKSRNSSKNNASNVQVSNTNELKLANLTEISPSLVLPKTHK